MSLTLRLICGYFLSSLLPFLTCIYETLLDLEMYKMNVSSFIGVFIKVYQSMPSIFRHGILIPGQKPYLPLAFAY